MIRRLPRFTLLAMALLCLAGCMDAEAMRKRDESFANQAVAASTRHCIDGVSYIATQVRGGYSLAPHLRPDGKPVTCTVAERYER